MKKLLFTVLILSVFTFYGNAYIIGNWYLNVNWSGPTGQVTFPSGTGSYYLDYDIALSKTNPVGEPADEPTNQGFCVENKNASSGTELYTLLSIDSGLGGFGLNAQNFMAAAYIAQNFYQTHQPAAQIAIWEIVIDGVDNFNLDDGDFTSNVYKSEALQLLYERPTSFSPNTQWALAVNPTVTTPGQIELKEYQNYLVQYHVPEPSILLLLGSGLIGLGTIRRYTKSRR